MTSNSDSRVGVLGTGLMGTAMAHRLLDQRVSVIAWDREPEHARALAERGADVAGSARELVSRAQFVVTMLPTADIVLAVVQPLLDEWPKETIWLQMSSVGAAEADRLAQVASAHGVTLFDAPVSGSTHPAEEGKLTILASGPDSARARVEPVFEALGSRVQWVGEAGMGSRLKLAANHCMIAMVAALAEAMHLCQLMGVKEQQFVALLDGGPLGSSYRPKPPPDRLHRALPADRQRSRSDPARRRRAARILRQRSRQRAARTEIRQRRLWLVWHRVARPIGVLVHRRDRPDTYHKAEQAGRIADDIPTNHNPKFAPVIHPTLETGVQAITTATLSYLGRANRTAMAMNTRAPNAAAAAANRVRSTCAPAARRAS